MPDSLCLTVMSEVHNILNESAHGGHAKTYNRITSTYYWPKMSQDIKQYVSTCDICQKVKPDTTHQSDYSNLFQYLPNCSK